MHIEFYTPQGQVKEWLINYAKDKLLKFHHLDKEISGAKVTFLKGGGEDDNKICEIEVTIYGDSLFARRNADSYEQAARDVLTGLEAEINELVAKLSELPEETTSTVKVL